MIRKDVKIGAAVLAILIAVIVVYALVVPSGPPAPAVNADDAFKQQMIERETTLVDPTKRTVASNEPAVVKTETPAAPVPAPEVAKKTDPFEDEKWMMALNTGAVPPTRTPNRASTLDAIRTDLTVTKQPKAESPAVGNSPASIAGPTAPPAGTAAKTYTVQTGDSIARIAESVYGSQVYYKAILDANPNVNPMKLKPGMVLAIPDVKETRGRGGHDDDAPAPAVDAKNEYRVTTGDSLNKIAIKLYGKADRWEEIYDLNKDKIGADPARLKLGMILKLPAAPTR